jgi:hypothetical protein
MLSLGIERKNIWVGFRFVKEKIGFLFCVALGSGFGHNVLNVIKYLLVSSFVSSIIGDNLSSSSLVD